MPSAPRSMSASSPCPSSLPSGDSTMKIDPKSKNPSLALNDGQPQTNITPLTELWWPPLTLNDATFTGIRRENIADFLRPSPRRRRRFKKGTRREDFIFDTKQYPDCTRATQSKLVKHIKQSFMEQGQEIKVHEWATGTPSEKKTEKKKKPKKKEDEKRKTLRIRLRCCHSKSGCEFNFQLCFGISERRYWYLRRGCGNNTHSNHPNCVGKGCTQKHPRPTKRGSESSLDDLGIDIKKVRREPAVDEQRDDTSHRVFQKTVVSGEKIHVKEYQTNNPSSDNPSSGPLLLPPPLLEVRSLERGLEKRCTGADTIQRSVPNTQDNSVNSMLCDLLCEFEEEGEKEKLLPFMNGGYMSNDVQSPTPSEVVRPLLDDMQAAKPTAEVKVWKSDSRSMSPLPDGLGTPIGHHRKSTSMCASALTSLKSIDDLSAKLSYWSLSEAKVLLRDDDYSSLSSNSAVPTTTVAPVPPILGRRRTAESSPSSPIVNGKHPPRPTGVRRMSSDGNKYAGLSLHQLRALTEQFGKETKETTGTVRRYSCGSDISLLSSSSMKNVKKKAAPLDTPTVFGLS